MRFKLIILLAVIVSFGLLFCGGGDKKADDGKPIKSSEAKQPSWLNASGLDGDKYVAVGIAEGIPTEAEAKTQAESKGLAALARICVSNITAQVEKATTTTEKDSVEERSSQMEEVINVETDAKLKGASTEHTYWEQYADGYKYYAYVTISKKALEDVMYAAKRALAEVDGLIKEAEELCNSGKIGEGVVKYSEAARNALILQENVTRFPKIMDQISSVLKSIDWKLDPKSDNQKGTLKNGLSYPIKVQLTYKGNSVIDTPIKLFLYEQKGSQYDKEGVTNGSGEVEFNVKRITVPGERLKAKVSLNVKGALDQLRRIKTPAYRAAATQLEEALEKNGRDVVYGADSPERKLKTALVTVEVIPGSGSSVGGRSDTVLRTALQENGFNLVTVAKLDANQLVDKSDSQRIAYLKKELQSNGIKRAFVAIFVGNDADKGKTRVKVVGDLLYYDLENDTLITSKTGDKRKSGSNTRDAFNNSMNDVVDDLVKDIKKGMF